MELREEYPSIYASSDAYSDEISTNDRDQRSKLRNTFRKYTRTDQQELHETPYTEIESSDHQAKLDGANFVENNIMLCSCRAKEVTIYCKDHDEVVCMDCKTLRHGTCTACSIKEQYKAFNFENAYVQFSTINGLEYTFNKRLADGHKALEMLEILTSTCKESIKRLISEVKSNIHKMEANNQDDLDKISKSHETFLGRNMGKCEIGLRKLQADIHSAFRAKTDPRQSFIWNIKLSKTLSELEAIINNMDAEESETLLSFKPNPTLLDVVTWGKLLGSVESLGDKDECNTLGVICIESVTKSDVTLLPNEFSARLTGSVVMPTGEVILCDRYNMCLKLLDNKYEAKMRLNLTSKPWDLVCFNKTDVLITLPSDKKLQFVQVFPTLQLEQCVKFDKACWGIDVNNDELYISFHNNPGEGEIRVFDRICQLKRKIGVDQIDPFMFSRPYYVKCSVTGDVYVSDEDLKCFTRLSKRGFRLGTVSGTDLKKPLGMCSDDNRNVFICDGQSRTITIYKEDGKNIKTLFTSSDGLFVAYSISYCQADSCLVIGGNGNSVLLLKLGYCKP